MTNVRICPSQAISTWRMCVQRGETKEGYLAWLANQRVVNKVLTEQQKKPSK